MDVINSGVWYWLTFIIFSFPASIIDIKHKRIPDWIVFPGIIILLGLRIFYFDNFTVRVIPEMLTGSLIFFCVRLLTKGKLGMGDVKFAALMAVFIGFPGWFIAAGIASLLGLLFAMAGLFTGKLTRESMIPFAPFLTVGCLGAYFINYEKLLLQ